MIYVITAVVTWFVVLGAYMFGHALGYRRGIDDACEALRLGIADESPYRAQLEAAREGRN